jgi:flagellum-specific peptidoglycan hydrolase FlgJ
MINTFAFIQAVKGQAITDMNEHGILASLTIAQAILESGWGESFLAKEGNNLFGIKKGDTWKGEVLTLPTWEYVNNMRTQIYDEFRKYSSWGESIADHTKLLLQPRYSNLINDTDYKSVCNKIYQDGYATDIKYPSKLINIIETYRLHELDINFKIERLMFEMDIKQLQRWLNANGFTDENGNVLDVDGVEGKHTKNAKEKAKTLLNYILK